MSKKNKFFMCPNFRLLPALSLGVILFFGTSLLQAQVRQTRGVEPVGEKQSSTKTGNIYAVVVGISDYKNPNITDLQFAHTDATAFAQFLQSPAGGNVPDSNIVFLINENATLGQVAAAMDGLLERCHEGDRAIIYFSGHGDVERKTITQPGFLLCEDAPASVYMGGGAFPLVFLQEIISTLSLQNGTDVIIFTDACRAGKLAGSSIGGPEVTAANLAKMSASATKVLSCQPNELSLESTDWGGGRGVFSYFLLNGMIGLADRNKDGVVTVLEIERYLEDEVSNAVAPHQQLPMVVGNKTTPIAWVDSASLAALRVALEQNQQPTLASIDSRSMENALLAGRDSSALFQYRQFKKAVKAGNLLKPEDQSAYTLFMQLKDRPIMQPFQGLMRRNLAAAFQDEAQQAINDYLASEPGELRKRWDFDTRYEHFPIYLEKAAEILGADHYMYAVLKAREQYFRGLNLRLQGERERDKSKFQTAMERQQDALEWAPDAAYAYNELGLLERRLGNYKNSERYFEKALEQTPQWALPWTNLSAIYVDQEDYELGITCGQRAAELAPAFPLVQFNLGVAYAALGQTEEAKKYYKKTLKLDPKYSDAYFNLGLVFYHDKDPEEAGRLWEKYAQLMPKDPAIFQNLAVVYMDTGDPDAAFAALDHALEIAPDYHEAQFNIAELYLRQKNYAKATTALKDYQRRQPQDPRSPYIFARIQAEQNNMAEAMRELEESFKLGFTDKAALEQDASMEAIRNHPDYAELIAKYFPKN